MEKIKQLIYDGNTQEAINQLNIIISKDQTIDEAYYLRGNAYRKEGNWKNAVNDYLAAMELNPDSPAHQAYQMAIEILSFYNKDMFNH